jgi:hypothetical protein
MKLLHCFQLLAHRFFAWRVCDQLLTSDSVFLTNKWLVKIYSNLYVGLLEVWLRSLSSLIYLDQFTTLGDWGDFLGVECRVVQPSPHDNWIEIVDVAESFWLSFSHFGKLLF